MRKILLPTRMDATSMKFAHRMSKYAQDPFANKNVFKLRWSLRGVFVLGWYTTQGDKNNSLYNIHSKNGRLLLLMETSAVVDAYIVFSLMETSAVVVAYTVFS